MPSQKFALGFSSLDKELENTNEETFVPTNELEIALLRAAKDPNSRPEFYRALLEADLFFVTPNPPAEEGGRMIPEGEKIAFITWSGPDGLFVPIFSSLPLLQNAIKNSGKDYGYNKLNGKAAFETFAQSPNEMLLNPGYVCGKHFLPKEILSIADGSIFGVKTQVRKKRRQVSVIVEINDYTTALGWEKALLLLSMDRTMPFWKELGLNFSHADEIKTAIQSFISVQQRLWDAVHPNDDIAPYLDQIYLLVNALLMKIRKVEGYGGDVLFLNWIEDTYFPAKYDGQWLSAWQIFLFHLANEEALLLSQRELSQDKLKQLVKLAKEWNVAWKDIARRFALAEAEPLIGWDLEQYTYCRHKDRDTSPVDELLKYLVAYRFSKIWQQLIQLLDSHEMEILNCWGQMEALGKNRISTSWDEVPIRYQKSNGIFNKLSKLMKFW